jgi:hypothetical protein
LNNDKEKAGKKLMECVDVTEELALKLMESLVQKYKV